MSIEKLEELMRKVEQTAEFINMLKDREKKYKEQIVLLNNKLDEINKENAELKDINIRLKDELLKSHSIYKIIEDKVTNLLNKFPDFTSMFFDEYDPKNDIHYDKGQYVNSTKNNNFINNNALFNNETIEKNQNIDNNKKNQDFLTNNNDFSKKENLKTEKIENYEENYHDEASLFNNSNKYNENINKYNDEEENSSLEINKKDEEIPVYIESSEEELDYENIFGQDSEYNEKERIGKELPKGVL